MKHSQSSKSLRDKYEKATIPIGKALGRLKISANMMTIISVIFAGISTYFLALRDLWMGVLFFLIAGICDMLDGAIARATGTASPFGTLLDNTIDRVVEGFLILGLILGEFIPGWLGVITILGMYLPSYVRARGEAEIGERALGYGLFERKEKLGTLLAGIFLTGFDIPMIEELKNIGITNYIFLACLIVSIFSIITAIQRLYFFYTKHKEKASF